MAGAAIAAQPVVALSIIGDVGAMLSNSCVVVAAAPEFRRARPQMLKIITRLRRSIGFGYWKKNYKENETCVGRQGARQFIYNGDE
ncbi:hypothetical protein COCNU_03G010710 [Cocos nucifera]|uniref:Uncharacterized protein n=1 Tax=Cocos nucifera TaxID=13894 RepID=A0A8K0I338_COCNU|nr:hypothetical protein COCNU_03G010710 [Cocos nucifera]